MAYSQGVEVRVGDMHLCAEFHYDSMKESCTPHRRSCSDAGWFVLGYLKNFFGFFQLAAATTTVLIWTLSVLQGIVSHKNVAFLGVPKTIFLTVCIALYG